MRSANLTNLLFVPSNNKAGKLLEKLIASRTSSGLRTYFEITEKGNQALSIQDNIKVLIPGSYVALGILCPPSYVWNVRVKVECMVAHNPINRQVKGISLNRHVMVKESFQEHGVVAP